MALARSIGAQAAALLASTLVTVVASSCTYDYAGAERCNNGLRDGDELGIDCGGSCVFTEGDVTTGLCACQNGTKEDGETDVDCGGVCLGDPSAANGGVCNYGNRCSEPADCDEAVASCQLGRCRPLALRGKWTRLAHDKPPKRFGARLTFLSGTAVLVGGYDKVTPALQETWIYDGDWSDRLMEAPARYYHAQAYDPFLSRVIIAAGQSNGGVRLRDAWARDVDGDWTKLPNLPQSLVGAAMVNDSKHHQMIVYGETDMNHVWTLPSDPDAEWKQVTTSGGPPVPYYHAMAFDTAHGLAVRFGGRTNESKRGSSVTAVLDPDTWKWKVLDVTGPSSRWGSVMAYDSDRNRAVSFGGRYGTKSDSEPFDDTWDWDGSAWKELTCIGEKPPGTFHDAMDYDPSTHRMLLFAGGTAGYKPISETWELGILGIPCDTDSDCAYHLFCADELCCDSPCENGSCSQRDSPGQCVE